MGGYTLQISLAVWLRAVRCKEARDRMTKAVEMHLSATREDGDEIPNRRDSSWWTWPESEELDCRRNARQSECQRAGPKFCYTGCFTGGARKAEVRRRKSGRVAERLMATDCKSVAPCELRRFESSPVHQIRF